MNDYQSVFETFEKKASSESPSWMTPIRKAAISRFSKLDFPTIKEEEWRYTNVEPIAKSSFHFALEPGGDGVTTEKIKPLLFGEAGGARLVFLNGIYRKEWSSFSKRFEGITLESLREGLLSHPEALRPYLAQKADFHHHAFTALNTAFIHDGVFLSVPKGKVIEEPVEILFITSFPLTLLPSPPQGERVGVRGTISQPRVLIILGENSKAAVIENYLSLTGDEEGCLTNSVAEIHLEPAAQLTYYRLQRESALAFHVGTTEVFASRDSHFLSFAFSFGARLSRSNLNITLGGEGSSSELNGLYMVKDHQHVDHHTIVDHTKPHGTSRQLYKGVLRDQSRAVFNGKIFVRRDAQKTDAHQTNKNLLLSKGAAVDTKPQLEIFADDVKCSHGAAVGQLEEDAIFYVKSRGFSDETAQSLLTYGFASEVIQRVPLEELRTRLDQLVAASLFLSERGALPLLRRQAGDS